MRAGNCGAPKQQGFTYFGIMLGVLLIGIALAAVGTVTRTEVQREREVELLWIGEQFRQAIAHYYLSGARLPQTLEDLLVDNRTARGSHHLRRLYADPITGQADWQFLRTADGGIYGVYSPSSAVPRKRAGFTGADLGFEDAPCYRGWRFIYLPHRNLMPPTRSASICAGN
jgi:type II secretory pathway pseudopilin PulG